MPERADIVWIEFQPQKGKEIKKTRPALIISKKAYNARVGLALCVPITSKIKNYPFEVIIAHNEISGVILADQIRSLDFKIRNAKFIGKCDDKVYQEVIEKLKVLIE